MTEALETALPSSALRSDLTVMCISFRSTDEDVIISHRGLRSQILFELSEYGYKCGEPTM